MRQWDAETLRPLLESWDARVRRDVSRFHALVPEAAARGSVLRDPAGEDEIAAAEQRMTVRLPPSYRAFLALSNGAYASSLGAETATGSEHGLLAIQDVAPMVEADPMVVDLWTEIPELNDPAKDRPPTGSEPIEVACFARLRDGLALSQGVDAFIDVLVPRPGAEEWELWTMAKECTMAYRSFADFLLHEAEQPDYAPKPALADEYALRARGGDSIALHALAEIDDPRAVEIACEVLRDPSLNEMARAGAADPLGLLADPGALPALRRAYQEATFGQSRRRILAALDACGDPNIMALLEHAAAADPDESVRRLAEVRLGMRGSS